MHLVILALGLVTALKMAHHVYRSQTPRARPSDESDAVAWGCATIGLIVAALLIWIIR